MVEITQRTIQGRFLLKPSPRLNALVAGCLARAQKKTAAKVHAVAVLSSHFHLLASFETVEQMSRFMCHLKTNLSKEIGRLHDWPHSIFPERYHSVPVSDEPGMQLQRLEYLLSQGVKEGLVLSPRDWPGVHSAEALLGDEAIGGVWVDRTKLFAARQKDPSVREAELTSEVEVQLEPIPCLADLPPEKRRALLTELVESIEREAVTTHQREGTAPLGAEVACGFDPHTRPDRVVRSPKPHFHATGSVFRGLMAGFREFVAAYRAAAERLASGDRRAVFPENCFPPGLPFVQPT